MDKFKLNVEFISEDGHVADGTLKIDCAASTQFIAGALYQILDTIGEKNRKAVELATTRYYTEVLNL